jgi:hypothetical protein
LGTPEPTKTRMKAGTQNEEEHGMRFYLMLGENIQRQKYNTVNARSEINSSALVSS